MWTCPQGTSLEKSIKRFVDEDERDKFLTFVRGMLKWRSEDRKTAAQLLNDPWLRE